MKTTSLIKEGVPIVTELLCAQRFAARLVGLLGRRSLGPDRGMYLAPCGVIHTFFMRFDLDLFFVDGEMKVVRIVMGVKPWRWVSGGPLARGVVELEAGWLQRDSVVVNDQLSLGG